MLNFHFDAVNIHTSEGYFAFLRVLHIDLYVKAVPPVPPAVLLKVRSSRAVLRRQPRRLAGLSAPRVHLIT